MTLTTIGIVALILDRFLAVALRLAAMGESESGGHYRFWRNYGTALRRSVDVLAVSAAAMVIVGWVAEVSPMLFGAWHMLDFHHRLLNALAVFGFGYLVFEFLMAWTRTKFTAPVAIAHPGSDESEEPTPASRLATIMPLLQGFVGVAILAISAVVALAKLGVDTTPLLAGAGIFGLAISFGSQSLVRDIVAGIFYMADDAFRLGEYIEAGRLKGAVEKISLRSVRLRHSSGQIHTVPFGQLGSVTNFSRDWVTMKFNLRLARNIDIDFVRKTVKKIGLDLLEDEEIGKDFLQPLKMQGVADIQENALVLRFKFTVRPGKPTYIQRIAMKRIVTTFAEKGIAFATHSLFIQNAADSEADTDEIAAHPISAALAGIPPRPGA